MDLEQITRDIFRIPVIESHEVTALLDGQNYPVVNLGRKGIGILIPTEDAFAVSSSSHAIVLQLNAQRFELTGRVVHISPHESDNYLYGIELIDMSQDSEQAINEYIKKNRATLFAK